MALSERSEVVQRSLIDPVTSFFRAWTHYHGKDSTLTPNSELETLSSDLTSTFRIIYAMEGKTRKDMIDFDLAPPSRAVDRLKEAIRSAPSRSQLRTVIEWLDSDLQQAQNTTVPQQERPAMQREFLIAKLGAHITYLEGKFGHKLPWAERVEATQGVAPGFIDREDLLDQEWKSIAIFNQMGYRDLTEEELQRYRENNRVSDEEFAQIIEDNADPLLEDISKFLDRQIKPKFRVQTDYKDEYWVNWSDGVPGDFRLRYNTHPRHIDKKTKGKALAMAVHEVVGHFAQMEGWTQAINKKDTLSALGVTSTHDPEQVASEGLSQSIHLFVPDIATHISLAAEFELELEGGRQMVYNNIQLAVNLILEARGKGLDIKEVIKQLPEDMQQFFPQETDMELDMGMLTGIMTQYMNDFYPAEPEEEVGEQIKERTNDPDRSVYLFAYGIGFLLHKEIAKTLTEEDKKRYLDLNYSQPILPKQAIRIVKGFMQKNPQRYAKRQFAFQAA